MKRIYFCLSLLLFCHCSLSYGFRKESLTQSPPVRNTILLTEALKNLSVLYKVNFLYEQETISQKKVAFNTAEFKGKKIGEVLSGLLTPLNLGWYKIDDKNYSVYPLDKPQKSSGLKNSNHTTVSNQSLTDSLVTSQITGRVIDELQKPLEYVTLTLRRAADSSFVLNALSDSTGRFVFPGIKPGDYKIKVTAIGYAYFTTSLLSLNTQEGLIVEPIKLKALSETLHEVKIMASRPSVETRSDRFILNVENSPMAIGNSLQLLKSAPFVKVSADNSVTLQGKKTMILIDNKPVPDAILQNILETLPSGNISKVELITQPSSKYDASYGAVINITTKKSTTDGITASVRADGSMGSYGRSELNGTISYKHKALTLYGTAGINRSDYLFSVNSNRVLGDPKDPDLLTDNWRRLSNNKVFNFQLGADLELTKDQTIGVLINGNPMKFGGPWGTVNQFGKQGAAIDSTLYTNATFDQKASFYTYNLNYHLLADSGKNELTVLATLTPFRRNMFQSFPSVLLNALGETIKNPPVYQTVNISEINIYNAQLDYRHTLKQQWTLETGIKYQRTDSKSSVAYEIEKDNQFVSDPAYSNQSKLTEAIAGAYLILSKDWKNDKLQMGVRTENTKVAFKGVFDQNYFNAFPSFLYQHNFNEHNNLAFSFKRTISRAAYYDLVPYTVFINKYTVEHGNSTLKPEYDNIYTITSNIHKLNLSLSYTAASGLIVLLPSSQDYTTKVTFFSRQNLNNSSDLSFFLLYPLRFNSWWETQNSGTPIGYTKARGQVLGNPYELSAFHSDFKSSHIFQLSKTLKLQVDAYYWTRYSQGLTKYSGYKNIDASFLLDIFSGKGQVRLSGNEIIFKRNDFHQDTDFGQYRAQQIVNNDSRRISVGFTYKFGKNKMNSPEKKAGNEEALKRL